MGVVAALLDGRQAAATLRRTLPKAQHSTLVCRHSRQLVRTLEERLLDLMVIGPRAARAVDLPGLRARFPRVPLVVFGPIRPDDAATVLEYDSERDAAAVLVEGIDDPLLGEVVTRQSQTARRIHALRDGPRALRLTEPLQQSAWAELVRTAGKPLPTKTLATRLAVSREHLSRQFGAGGAPNLKRVMDFLRVIVARELAANPGHDAASIGRVLGFSTPSHLRAVVRRVVGASVTELPRLGVAELLRRFGREGARSRR